MVDLQLAFLQAQFHASVQFAKVQLAELQMSFQYTFYFGMYSSWLDPLHTKRNNLSDCTNAILSLQKAISYLPTFHIN